MSDIRVSYSRVKALGFFTGPLLLLLTLVTPPPEGLTPEAWRACGMAFLMATWWMTEAVSLSVTALVPLAVVPLLAIGSIKHAAVHFASPAIFLYLGGFIIAVAMEKWKLHVRIALNIIRLISTPPRTLTFMMTVLASLIIITAGAQFDQEERRIAAYFIGAATLIFTILRLFGSHPSTIIAGFMVATALLSMWISNTATAVMMLPIGLSVIRLLTDELRTDDTHGVRKMGTALMLGIAYAASIGGITTLVGTPPNAVFKGFMEANYGIEINLVDWMTAALPLAGIMLVATWFLLTQVMYRASIPESGNTRKVIDRELEALGPMRREEKLVLGVFLLTAMGWICRRQLNEWVGAQPWGAGVQITDAVIAISGALLTFLIPSSFREGKFLLSWQDAERLPWGVLLLLGGGLSLAATLTRTGFADWLGNEFSETRGISVLLFILLVTAVMVFLTELMSNVAVTTAFLPVVAVAAAALGENPLIVAIPATVAASCAFMMPVATPPNAIVFASGYITVPQMMRAGFFLNLLAIGLITFLTYTLVTDVFGITPGVQPEWAHPRTELR